MQLIHDNAAAAEINLSAIQRNFNRLASIGGAKNTLAVVKANAYGHGLIEVAKALTAADGFAVSRLSEAVTLRDSGITQKILLMCSHITTDTIVTCQQQHIDIIVHTLDCIEMLSQMTINNSLGIWLKIDTGMHRLGIAPTQVERALRSLKKLNNIEIIAVMSHFSDAEIVNGESAQQQRCFYDAIGTAEWPASIENSAGLIASYITPSNWARPGIALYGASPTKQDDGEAPSVKLEAAMHFHAPIIAIRNVPAGDHVGYNSTWFAGKDTRIATIACGYADGYPRHAKNGTPVEINGRRYPLAGRVSMDLITVDIGDSDVAIGDRATLWGATLKVEEIADHADTISYQLFTNVAQRVARTYHCDASVAKP